MKYLSKIGAVAFILWGVLHIVGGETIFFALGSGPDEGFAVYRNHAGIYSPLAGAILGYLAFFLVAAGVVATGVGIWLNWKNSLLGLTINTILIGFTDLGLALFLLLPGFVSIAHASIGFVLYLVGILACGIACQKEHGGKSA